MINKHGGNEPLTGGDELGMPRLTFDQVNNAELVRDWKRERITEIAANPSLADGYRSAGFGGLVDMALQVAALKEVLGG